MKKNIIISLLLLAFSTNIAISQSVNTFNLAAKKGDFIVDGYYGFFDFSDPRIFGAPWWFVGFRNIDEASHRSIGPIGARAEYMVTDMIGLGMEFNYSAHYATWIEGAYSYEYSVTRIRAFPRFNIHFSNSEKLDAYVGAGLGYRDLVRSFSSDDPNHQNKTMPAVFPIALRFGIGVRYFFTDHIGLGLEFGLGGGAVFNPCLSIKI